LYPRVLWSHGGSALTGPPRQMNSSALVQRLDGRRIESYQEADALTVPAAAQAVNAGRGAGDGFSPTRILEIELTAPLPRIDHDGPYGRAWMLVRLQTEPIGICVAPLPPEGIAPDELAGLIWRELAEPIAERVTAAGQPRPAGLTGGGLPAPAQSWPYERDRAAVLAKAPFISVVVCTRDRPEQIGKCLSRLAQQQYPRYEVVVVDNAPTSDALREVVEGQAGTGADFRYCVEPRPGLSWARNEGIRAAKSDIIAFLDDDDEPDEHWLTAIADGFAHGERIGCVSGIVLPARLDSAVEELFEQVGGHSKGRGFVRETFDKSGPQSPLFPLPPFGVGANMAFSRAALDRIGGFDVALGAGTPTSAGEDTLALTLVLLAGYEIAYQPSALMWHHHRTDLASLNRQLHGYSVGLTAFYAALVRRRPGAFFGLLKLLPAAAGYLTGGRGAAVETPEDPPLALAAELDRRQLQGMLAGPAAYLRSRRVQRRVAAAARKR
jgi:O-antigen biosynthesis protein